MPVFEALIVGWQAQGYELPPSITVSHTAVGGVRKMGRRFLCSVVIALRC
jgi:hypothetical protein